MYAKSLRLLQPLRFMSVMLASILTGYFVLASLLALSSQPVAAGQSGPAAGSVAMETATPTPPGTPVPLHEPVLSTDTSNECDRSGDPANEPDSYEPADNIQDGATLLAVGTNQIHNLCSATPALDLDWYYFEAVTTQRYMIATGNLSAVVDTYMIVQGPNGFQVQDDDSGSGLGSQVIFMPQVDGRYYVQITQASKSPFNINATGLPRAYTIFLSAQAAPTPTPTTTPFAATATPTGTPSPCRDSYEFDDVPAAAKPLYVRQRQHHILCGDGDIDWVWFDAVAGKPYRIFTSDLADGLDTLIVLYDSDGETVLQLNDDYPGLGLASRIDLISPVTARYYLKVQDSVGHGAENFTYTLRLESDGLPIAGPCLDTFEPDGLPDDAAEILLRETQAHTFCPEGDADWVRFFAQGGKNYTLLTSDLTIGTDTIINVFGPSATGIIAQDDDGAGNLASRVEFVAPVSGTYYAQIKNVGDIGGKGQEYSLALTSGGATIVSTAVARTPVSSTPTPASTRTPTPAVSATATAIALTDQYRSASAQTAAAIDFADRNFATTWRRADAPVRERRAQRSWYWGAQAEAASYEPYKGAPGGTRLVQYFDKARMEITQPEADRTDPWYVTNGLLVHEMISGLLQLGDATSERRPAAEIPLAGDGDERAPTYASLSAIASLDNDRRVPDRVGLPVNETLSRAGKIMVRSDQGPTVVNAVYISATGHNIPDVFWRFFQQHGTVRTDAGYEEALVSDWLFAFGLPLTEAYWTRATIGGVERDVLVQAFERRILTYTPDNPDGWQVEMGNVGQHYYRWRYGSQP